MKEYGVLFDILKLKSYFENIQNKKDYLLSEYDLNELKAILCLLEGIAPELMTLENEIRRNVESRLKEFKEEVSRELS